MRINLKKIRQERGLTQDKRLMRSDAAAALEDLFEVPQRQLRATEKEPDGNPAK